MTKWWKRPERIQLARAIAVTATGILGAAAALSATAGAANATRVVLGLAALLGGCAVLALTWREQTLPKVWVREYLDYARERPADLVGTAGPIMGAVVGRDHLCTVIESGLTDRRRRHARRPFVVVAGSGAGKTALLVRLTQRLAQRGSVPVPIDLANASPGIPLNFVAEARRRFLEVAGERSLLLASEAEAVWRQLEENNLVVVLADNLEQLPVDSAEMAGDITRRAINDAARRRVPLVVASRPHDALAGLNADIVELDELSEDAALAYVKEKSSTYDEHRIHWVIQSAQVTEAPLYLQIARELHQQQLLDGRQLRGPRLDTRDVDPASLRLRLLETWTDALIGGHFASQLPMPPALRAATVDQLAALACMGVREDTLEVDFARLFERAPSQEHGEGGPFRYAGLIARLEDTIAAANQIEMAGNTLRVNIEREVRLAAIRGQQLRLVEPLGDGVRFPHGILQAYLASRVIGYAIHDDPEYLPGALTKAGRELLVALTMFSRGQAAQRDVIRLMCDALLFAANNAQLRTAKQLDLLATALQVDCVDQEPKHRVIAAELMRHWPRAFEDRSVEEAKLKAIARFADAARTVGPSRPLGQSEPAYRELFEIGRSDLSYRVRLAAARELGTGGDAAFVALTEDRASGGQGPSYLEPGDDQEWMAETDRRDLAFKAWLAPMLASSTVERQRDAQRNLARWLERVGADGNGSTEPSFPLSLEIALAQGFKHAANRRREHPQAQIRAESNLAEKATEMLAAARFWYSRLTLVHALCLWTLAQRRASRGRGSSDAVASIEQWLYLPTWHKEHPFVSEAFQLARLALDDGQPERFIWASETDANLKVGSSQPGTVPDEGRLEWIPRSAGWALLEPRAQQLLADVLLLLNLIERDGRDPEEHERRMRHATRDELPPCLTGQRQTHLQPERTVGMTHIGPPGTSCKGGCLFGLCPYPAKGQQPYRVELTKALCRQQQALLTRPNSRAPWQRVSRAELGAFWRAMEERTHS